MISLRQKANQWPRRKDKQLIFNTTNDAILYANLIYNDKRLVDEIDLYHRIARRELKILRQRPDPNLDILMHIAVKAQFFRECLDEVRRIREENKK